MKNLTFKSLAALSIALAFSINSYAAAETPALTTVPSATAATSSEQYSQAEAKALLKQFISAIKNDDKQGAAEMFLYPKMLLLNSKDSRYISSADELVKHYDEIFTADFKEHLSKLDLNDLSYENDSISADNGHIWLTRHNGTLYISSVFTAADRASGIVYYEGNSRDYIDTAAYNGNTINYTVPVIQNPLLTEANAYFSRNLARSMYAYMPYAADEYGKVKDGYLKDRYTADELNDIAKIADFYHTRKNKAALQKQEYSNRYDMFADYAVKLNDQQYLSVLQSIYTYSGGAHGNTVRYSLTLDKQTGAPVALSDLFDSDAYLYTLNEYAAQQNKDLFLFEPVKITGQESFYLTDSELVIYYQQYEVAPYAAGFVEYHFPYASLQSVLK